MVQGRKKPSRFQELPATTAQAQQAWGERLWTRLVGRPGRGVAGREGQDGTVKEGSDMIQFACKKIP